MCRLRNRTKVLRCPKVNSVNGDAEAEPIMEFAYHFRTRYSPAHNDGVDSMLNIKLGELDVKWDNQSITEFIGIVQAAAALPLEIEDAAARSEPRQRGRARQS